MEMTMLMPTTDHMPRHPLVCHMGLYVALQVIDSPEYPQNLFKYTNTHIH